MRDFKLERLPEPTLIDGRRHYETPYGYYPSVTTVLSVLNKKSLDKWKERVGEDKAESIKRKAAYRGSNLHNLLERYCYGEKITNANTSPLEFSMFLPIKNFLDSSTDDLWCVETPLYSNKLKVAGKTDLVATFDKIPTIVDFKSSLKEKKEKYVFGYKLQVCAYAYMFEERTGINIPKYKILIASEAGDFQIFEGDTADHIKDFALARYKYKTMFNT